MKKAFFSIIGLLFGLTGICQIPKSEVVNATLPQGTKSLTKEQTSTILRNNFKRNEVPTDNKSLNIQNYYQMNGLIIAFWDDEVNPPFNRSLEEISSGMTGIFKYNHDTVNFNRIITLNNVKYLEYEIQKEDEAYLWFQSEVNKNNKSICGVIQFKKQDETKAEKYLDDLLKSVHFK
jgi:hypothetical protein